MSTETETEWTDAAGEVSTKPAGETFPHLITWGGKLRKVNTQLEFLFNRTVLTKKQCRCYGCGVAHPAGSRMSNVLAVKTIDKKADYVTLHFCRICREIGKSFTDPEWRALRPGQLRHTHREEWLKLHHEHNPPAEV